AATQAAFDSAANVVALDLVNHRIAPMAIEPRVSVARYDAGRDHLTLVSSCQLPHEVQRMMAKDVFQVPETRLDVIAPDVGGGFGMKSYIYPEDVITLWAARRLGRDVAWVGDRTEAFLGDSGARDHITSAELALDSEHRFLAMRVGITANMGAYLSQHAAAVPTIYCTFVLPGPYRFDATFVDVRTVFSHSAPLDAYRGAGRSEAVYVTERLIDHAARSLAIDPVELRRHNLVTPEELPYMTALGSRLDSGDAPALLARALERSDQDGFAVRRDAARNEGKLLGRGLAMYAANCGGCSSENARSVGAQVGSWESARLQIHPSGAATLFVGSHNHGQGHETSFAQLVVEKTGLDLDAIEVVFGDTSKVQRGMGTFASRSAVICGPAIGVATERVIEKAKRIAAHLLEASDGDIELVDGRFKIVGTDRSVPFAEVAQAAYTYAGFGEDGREPGLDETGFYDPEDFTYPFGAHIAEVEIDAATGSTRLARYVALDDIGVEINPLIVEGQIHGGVVQGVGQALMEAMLYDNESGQLVTGSFMDYEMPRADGLCAIESERIASRCTTNPLGAKGAGEAGTFAAPAAVTNAVLDAMAMAGVTHFDMPATPLRVWRALQAVSD
ncbi:MAG: molybdopterin-dependent oxidoreductase, partial [Rhodospirillaceae bacterium]|nr:molybdopterin-dependent oxidoreductase [Rhodospirillaceae bacterium]